MISAISPSLFANGYYQTIISRIGNDVKARLDIENEWSLSQPGSGMDWFCGKMPSDHKYFEREIEQTLAVLFGASHVSHPFLARSKNNEARPTAIETFIYSWDPKYKFTKEDLAQLGGITVKTQQAFRTVDNFWYTNFYQGDVVDQVISANSNFSSLNAFFSWWSDFHPDEKISLTDLKNLVGKKLFAMNRRRVFGNFSRNGKRLLANLYRC